MGAAAVMLDRHNKTKRFWQVSIGSTKHWPVHEAELIAVYYAIEMAQSEHKENHHGTQTPDRTFTIASDSKSAL